MHFYSRTTACLAAIAGSFLLCGVTAAQMSTAIPPSQPSQTGLNSPMSPNTNNVGAPEPGLVSPEDRVFLKSALEGGMFEVQLGQLALQKSNNADVKAFAQKMVDDHTKMGDQMKTMAEQIGVKLPKEISKKDHATMAKLQALSGEEFDKAYMEDMVKGHKTDLNEFQIEADGGSSPPVKDVANRGAQLISQHLQMAEQIDRKTVAVAASPSMK